MWSNGSINNEPALIHMIKERPLGDKPLPEPVVIQFIDAYILSKSQWCVASSSLWNWYE